MKKNKNRVGLKAKDHEGNDNSRRERNHKAADLKGHIRIKDSGGDTMFKSAFTLIELIVVMAVIGILVLIAAPKFLGYTQKAQDTKHIHTAKVIETALEAYLIHGGEFPTDLEVVDPTSLSEAATNKKLIGVGGYVSTLDGETYYELTHDFIEKLDVKLSAKAATSKFFIEALAENMPNAIYSSTQGITLVDKDKLLKGYVAGGGNVDSGTENPNSPVVPEGPARFIKTYGGTGFENAFSSVRTRDGGYILVGSTTSINGNLIGSMKTTTDVDTYIIKLDESGEKQWAKSIKGSGNEFFKSVTEVSNGDFIAVGYSASSDGDFSGFAKGTYDNAIVARYSPQGELLWHNSLMLAGGINSFDSVSPTSDGGYVVSGRSDKSINATTGADAVLVKYNNSNEIEWQKSFGGPNSDLFKKAIQTRDGGYAAVGHSDSNNGDMPNSGGGEDGVLVKYDSNGNQLFISVFDGLKQDIFMDIIQAEDGGFYVTGRSLSIDGAMSGKNKGLADGILIKYNSQGNREWIQSFGGEGYDTFVSATLTTDGDIIAIGESPSTGGDMTGLNKGDMDGVIVKYSELGVKLWSKSFGGSGIDSLLSISPAGMDSFIISGRSNSSSYDLSGLNINMNDAVIFKMDSSGNFQP